MSNKFNIGDRVLLMYYSNVIGESTISRITPTRLTLVSGLRVSVPSLRAYGKDKRMFTNIALPTPELEANREEYKEKLEAEKQLRKAKAKLSKHIDYMYIGYFARCTPEQIYRAVEALDEIFKDSKEHQLWMN